MNEKYNFKVNKLDPERDKLYDIDIIFSLLNSIDDHESQTQGWDPFVEPISNNNECSEGCKISKTQLDNEEGMLSFILTNVLILN